MKDQRTENFLARGAWKWAYHAKVSFSDIDIKSSRENPARHDRLIDDDRVIHYAMEMESGVEFPAIVLIGPAENNKFKHEVATGMHRLTAAETAGRTSIDAYLVTETEPYRREVLARQLNTIEGHGTTTAEEIRNIISLHRRYPERSLAELSREWNLKLGTVQTAWSAFQGRERARIAGFDLDRAKVPQKTAQRLNSIHSDRVFAAATALVVDRGFNSTVAEEMIVELRKFRNEDDQIGVILKLRQDEEQRVEKQKARTARTPIGPASLLIGHVKKFNNQVAKGLDRLYLDALSKPGILRANLEEMIENGKRLIAELDRRAAINTKQAAE